MNVFVDGGGNRCASVDRYLKLASFDKVYVFEPNPTFYKSYDDSDFELIKKAIWTENCTMPFHVSKDQNQVASSLLEEKLCKVDSEVVPFWYDEPLQVECVDFSEWLIKNVMTHNSLTLKLDIEGAEYDVLWKMIKDETILMVDKLYVEFHLATLPGKKETQEELIEALMSCGVEPFDWD